MPHKNSAERLEYISNWQKRNPEKCRAAVAKYRKNNPDNEKNGHLRRNYGITLEQYKEILKKQNGRCAICKSLPSEKRKLDVDHCRETGKIRGLLCLSCNAGIGNLKDDPELLLIAYKYLKEGDANVGDD